MRYYFRTKTGDARIRIKSNQAVQIPLLDFLYDSTKWTQCSFWQYYFPTWFPLTQQQKEVTNASCSDKANADDHQTYDPDFAVG